MPLPRELRRRLLEILRCPTAPFAEGRVHAAILRAVERSRRLRAAADRFGNLLVAYGPGRPRLLFACHTDHPALVANGDGTATVAGGIRGKALRGAKLRALENRGARGTVTRVLADALEVRVAVGGEFRRGTPLVLDLPEVAFRARRIHARAIDDLCAVALCLALFDRLEASGWRGSVGALFTRAEEVGFAGALAWVRTTAFPRSATIVNLEMSNARAHTPLGAGPILRVGDRISTFDPAVTEALEEAARGLERRERGFRWQRALMDGGACEATVYAHAGFRAGALCLPLRNYHNHAPRGGVATEYVHEDDARNLLLWMEAYARAFRRLGGGRRKAARLEQLWRRHRKRLLETAPEVARPRR